MTQPTLRTPALDTSARAALAAEFARALESPGLRPLLPRLTGALLPRFARYYEQLLHLPRRTRRAQRQWRCRLGALAVLLALGQAPAWAADLTVNSLADNATAADTECTLREAINNANGNSDTTSDDCVAGAGADTIRFSDSGSGTIILGSTLRITDGAGLTIDGTGQSVTVSGNNAVRVMLVNGVATLHLQNLTVANGDGADSGGVSNFGTLTVTNSTFSGNFAAFSGGILNSGTLTVTNSTFSGNTAGLFGGGIHNDDGGTLTVSNSTFSGNTAEEGGGGIDNNSTLTVTNSTFSGNSAIIPGGGIRSDGGSTTHLSNTLIANSPRGGDCFVEGAFPTNLNNLVEDGSCESSFPPNTDPNLGPLASNGGPTETHALLAGSPAIDAVTDGSCPPPNEDQRGVSRPQGVACDIGSFEAVPADLSVAKTDNPDPVLVRDQLTWTITVTNSGMSDATGVMLTDMLPASGFTFVSTSSSQGSCSPPASGVIDCDLGNLANGRTATVTIKVTPTAEGTLSNTVEVMGREFDDNLDNNEVTQTTTVAPLLCNGLTPTIVRDSGNNMITGTSGNDVIHGLGGNDTINGGNGNDTICGGEGTDTLNGNNGNDRLFGENGADTLNGNNGNDALDGGAGSGDTCNGGSGSDTGANCEPFNQ